MSIAKFKPRWFNGESLCELAPSADLLHRYKSDTVSEDAYKTEYFTMLDGVDILKLFSQFPEDARIVLLCYEKTGSFCHRHLLAEYLSEHYSISISELEVF